jgi:hypothetical protein
MRTCDKRPQGAVRYREAIPELVAIHDTFRHGNTAMLTMRKALQYQVSNRLNAVQMEDDVILCADFKARCLHEVRQRPEELIQLFSMRQDDLRVGSRYIAGYKYLMNQCFYLPLKIAKLALECFDEFEAQRKDNRIGGTDSLIQHTLKKHKLRYWSVVPNLADHEVGVSAIDSRRSSRRQSLTFKME